MVAVDDAVVLVSKPKSYINRWLTMKDARTAMFTEWTVAEKREVSKKQRGKRVGNKIGKTYGREGQANQCGHFASFSVSNGLRPEEGQLQVKGDKVRATHPSLISYLSNGLNPP